MRSARTVSDLCSSQMLDHECLCLCVYDIQVELDLVRQAGKPVDVFLCLLDIYLMLAILKLIRNFSI